MGSWKQKTMFHVCKVEDGMITVEASLVFPIILFVLVLILYFFFFCYESGVAAGALREELGKATDVAKTEGNADTGKYQIRSMNSRNITYLLHYNTGTLTKSVEGNIRKDMAKRSVFGSGTKVKVQISGGNIEGTVTSEIGIPILGSIKIGGFSFFKVQQHAKMQIRMPAEQIRRWQQLE